MKLTEARETLAAAAETYTTANVYDHLPDQLAVPAVLVGWGAPWLDPDTLCREMTAHAELVVVAGRIDMGDQLAVLERIVGELVNGFTDNPEWDTPRAPAGPYALEISSVTYLAVTLTTAATVTP